MKLKLEKKLKMLIKVAFILAIFTIIFMEFKKLFLDFNASVFYFYKDKLSIFSLVIIGILGIVSYFPLSLYDLIIKDTCEIDLDNKSLYRFSWIASSISSIVGFGGTSAIALKSYFYSPYIKDKSKLVKEVSKVVALNFTGFSMVCFVYSIFNISKLRDFQLVQLAIIIASFYTPSLLIYNLFRYRNIEKRKDAIKTIKIMCTSILEWITSVILIFGILTLLGTELRLSQIFPIYVVACAIGIISMVPGGLGTFDLSFILGVGALGVPKEEALLALVLYRVSYYMVPLFIGLILFINEMKKGIDKKYNNIFTSILTNLSYTVSSILIFLTGVMILLFRVMPHMKSTFRRMYVMREPINNLSITMEIVMGFLLIAISTMLLYKSKQTFKIVMVLVSIAWTGSIIGVYRYWQTGFLTFVIIFLFLSRHNFYRKSFVFSWEKLLKDSIALFGFLLVYLIMYFPRFSNRLHKFSAYTKEMVENSYNYLFISSIIGFIISIIFIGVIYLINKRNRYPFETFEDNKDKIKNILSNYKGNPLTHLIYLKDKYVFINEDNTVLIQYQKQSDKLVVLGNPIGDRNSILSAIEEFYDLADRYGYTPIFYQVDKEMIPMLHEYGYEFMKLGQEGIVDLSNFSVSGKKTRGLRATYNKIERAGYTFEIIEPPFNKDFIAELREVSNEWLGERYEKGFSIGFFNEEYLSLDKMAVVKDENGKIKCFANLMPMYDSERSFSIDLMRYSNDAIIGTMDFLMINLIAYGKENDYKNFDIGMAPLANVGTSKYSFISEKIAAQICIHGQSFYSFTGLRSFKEKYTKQWVPKYLAYRKKSSLPFTMIQIIYLCHRKVKAS
ncbi:bifunctional lysylphosphatidylglycerol flippase/synthetase MprF [Clostridium sp. CTA-7]